MFLQKNQQRFWAVMGGVFCAMTASLAAHAQDTKWPERPVKIIVPYSAGGSADTLGRIVAQGLTEAFKQPFVIENKTGAGGVIGSQLAAKSAPDGYTLVVSGVGSHVIAPAENPKTFDPMRDFTHIAILGGPPLVLAVNSSYPITDLKSFMAYAKNSKDGVSWGSPGQGTHGYLIGQSFEAITGMPMTHVAYKGAAPAVADLVAGHIPASFTTLSTASVHIQSSRLRAIAVTSSKRLTDFPNVPTFAELGYPKLTALTWFSLSGPANMPAPLVSRINVQVRKIMHSKQAQEELAKASMETFDWDVPRFNQYVVDEIKRWTPMVKKIQSTSN